MRPREGERLLVEMRGERRKRGKKGDAERDRAVSVAIGKGSVGMQGIGVDNLSPIKQQRNTELKTQQRKRKHRRSTTSKQLKATKEHKI